MGDSHLWQNPVQVMGSVTKHKCGRKRFPRDSSCSWVSNVLALGNRERDDVILLWSPVQRSLL